MDITENFSIGIKILLGIVIIVVVILTFMGAPGFDQAGWAMAWVSLFFISIFLFFSILTKNSFKNIEEIKKSPKQYAIFYVLLIAGWATFSFFPGEKVDNILGGKNTRNILSKVGLVFLILITFIYGMNFNLINPLVLFSTSFGEKTSEMYENNKYSAIFMTTLIGAFFVVGIMGLIYTLVNSEEIPGANKWIGTIISFLSIFVVIFAIYSFAKSSQEGKWASKIQNYLLSNPKKCWGAFSTILLSIFVPLAYYFDSAEDMKYKNEFTKCHKPSNTDSETYKNVPLLKIPSQEILNVEKVKANQKEVLGQKRNFPVVIFTVRKKNMDIPEKTIIQQKTTNGTPINAETTKDYKDEPLFKTFLRHDGVIGKIYIIKVKDDKIIEEDWENEFNKKNELEIGYPKFNGTGKNISNSWENLRKKKLVSNSKGDTIEEMTEEEKWCKKKAHQIAYGNNVEYKTYPIYVLLGIIAIGFLILFREQFYDFIKEPTILNITLFFSFILLATFIIFQTYAQTYVVDDKNIYQRTKTQPNMSKTTYNTSNIIFLIAGLISLLSLGTLIFKENIVGKPPKNNIKESFIWLFKELGVYFKFFGFIIGFILLISLFSYFLLTNRDVLGGFLNIIYLGIGLTFAIFIYKFLIDTTFFKDNLILNLLINIVFIIPCILFFIVEGTFNEFRDTPKIVFVVLLGQILLISTYILLPLLSKYFFRFYRGKNLETSQDIENDLIQKNINKLEEQKNQIFRDITFTNEFSPKDDHLSKYSITQADYIFIKNKENKITTKSQIKQYLEGKIPNDSSKKRANKFKLQNITELNKWGKSPTNKKENEKLDKIIGKLKKEPYYKSKSKYLQIINYLYYVTTSNKMLYIGDVVTQNTWEDIIRNKSYGSIENIENNNDIKIATTEVEIDTEMEEKIIELSGDKDYKSADRKNQVITYIYYYIRSLNKNDVADFSKLTKGNSLILQLQGKISKGKKKLSFVTEKIQNSFFNKTTLLLNKPIYLENEFIPKYLDGEKKGNYIEFQNMDTGIEKWNYNYGLSFWVNVHSQGANFRLSHNKFTNLLDYSNNPKISYNPSEDKLRVQVLVSLDNPSYDLKKNTFSCKQKTEESEKCSKKSENNCKLNKYCEYKKDENNCILNAEKSETGKFLFDSGGTLQTNFMDDKPWNTNFTKAITDWCKEDMTRDFRNLDEKSSILLTIFEKEGLLSKQKWNNIVFNYDLGKLDIFVNGKLEGTWNNDIQFMKYKKITIGEKDGISGGICNVAYHPSALTKTQIDFSYNILKLKNPPII